MRAIAAAVDRAGFHLLTLCAAIAPIPFGSNSAGLAGSLGLLLALCLLGSVAVPHANRTVARLSGAALALAAVVVACVAVQVVPTRHVAWANAAWSAAGPFIDEPEGTISVSRSQPLQSLGYVLLPIAAFLCSCAYVRGDGRYLTFVHVVLGINVAVTLVCMAQYIISPRWLLWEEKKFYLEAFTGSFVNPNTAATHFGLMLLISVAFALRQFDRGKLARSWLARGRWTASEHQLAWAFAAYALVAFIFALALLLTKSRAGILSSAAGVSAFAAAFLFAALRRSTSMTRAAAVTMVALSAGAAWFAWSGGGVLRRLELEGLSDPTRLCVYTVTWQAIRDNLWAGAGLGTFQDILPSYRTPACGLYGYWDTAHNFFLEGWLGLGATFVACVALVYFALLWTYVHGMRERRRFRLVPLACLCLLVIVTLHSAVDFSLQIPGLAIEVAAVLGAGCAISLGRTGPAAARHASP